MMKLKSIVSIAVIAAMLCTGLAGCSQKTDSAKSTEESASETPAETDGTLVFACESKSAINPLVNENEMTDIVFQVC